MDNSAASASSQSPSGAPETPPPAGSKRSPTRSGSPRRHGMVFNDGEGWARLRARFSQESPVPSLPRLSPVRSFTMPSRPLDSIEASEERGSEDGDEFAPQPGFAQYLVAPLNICKQRLVASPSEGTVTVARLENLATEPQVGSGGATSTSPHQITHVDQLEYLGLGGGESGSEAANASDGGSVRSFKSVSTVILNVGSSSSPSPPLATMPHFLESASPERPTTGVTRINERARLMDGLQKARLLLETLDPETQGTKRVLAKAWCPIVLQKQMLFYAFLCVHDDGFDPKSCKYMEEGQFKQDRDEEARNLRAAMHSQDCFIAALARGDQRCLNDIWARNVWIPRERKSMRTMWNEACERVKKALTQMPDEHEDEFEGKASTLIAELAANCQIVARAWGTAKVPLAELRNDEALFAPYAGLIWDADDDSDSESEDDETTVLATEQNTRPVIENETENQPLNVRAASMDWSAVTTGLLEDLQLGDDEHEHSGRRSV
ncbi:hypothetical protein HYALB_00007880 [Hymenoscyphus albidus]|uniref:Uncharacterized protein n=1 Tax=Hymenoscyphus albidus TaxID=595503 RepID=A0A9N9Q5Q1_9HELO|nr:hypothetical protein HYALB_00007880 [Hymenoscyphus albidus]